MTGDASSSSSGDGMKSSSEGVETELYRSQGAQLYLVDREESVLMRTGDFAFSLAIHSRAPLAALVAIVGDLQWPVGKDSPAMRVGDKCFTYALPGLIYGLVLGESTTASDIEGLEGILQEYATFEVHSDFTTGVVPEKETPVKVEGQADYWTKVAAAVERRSTRIGRRIQIGWWGSSRTMARRALSGVESSEGGVLSLRMKKRMEQVRRVSAIVKLFSRVLVKGVISPSRHVEMGAGGGGGEGDAEAAEVAVASVDAVTKVVELVETAGRSVLETAGSELIRRRCAELSAPAGPDFGRSNSPHSAPWTLNKEGLRMLYIASTTLINSGSSSSDTSATTSSGGSRLLSSSSSTGNSASPSSLPFHQALASSNTTPAPAPALPLLPPPPFRHPPPPPASTTSLHRPTPARPTSTLAAARRPPVFITPTPRPPGDATEHHSQE